MDKRYGAAALLAAVITVTGCGQAPAAPATTPATASPTTGSEQPAPQDVLVEVAVTGGLAGVDNRLTVKYDGTYTTRTGTKPSKSGRMTPAETAELRAALEDPAYAKVPASPTGSPIADGFQYSLTYAHRTVIAGDGERPPALDRAFKALPDGGPPTGR
ncbi:hypothetical protein [Streptomyces sp. NPDC050600]|uniref:hypothetical protein n=1 Tax=Streptomyces sp. NPDC050600 TaxID=3157213 RepID=UPI00342AE4FB